VSIEDTRELQLPKFLYWCPLTTRQPNQEGKGEVTMLDLLVNALRMRPDRIILGEIRKARDAEVLFEAMHTGHSVYSTVHADSINETIERLTNPPISVPPNLLGAVDLNIVMFRDRRTGIRRVYQVGELLTGDDSGIGKSSVKANILYRWNQGNDKIVKHQDSQKLYEHLSKHTSMSQSEIDQELAKRQKILDFMVKNKIRSMDQVGMVMKMYHANPNHLLRCIQNNSLKNLLEE
jgi:flagellar protein FlaI